jgi:hypothetical protein
MSHPPTTPGYPVIAKAFSAAFGAIMSGADARTELDRAAATIDTDPKAHNSYRQP